MTRSSLLLVASCAAAVGAGPAAAEPASAAGTWLTEGGAATVRIGACPGDGERLCGWIVALKQPNDRAGKPKRDTANTDPMLRGRTIVGMPFLAGFRTAGPGRWKGGRIYNPGDGKTYASNLALTPAGALKVNGCVLVVCQAQTWTRVAS